METQTLNFLSFVLVLALYAGGGLVMFLRWLAPLTKTDLDDKAVAGFDAMRSWVFRLSPHLWAIVEEMCLAGLLRREDKLFVYLQRFRVAFKDIFNTELPAPLLEEAKLLAASLSAKDRIARNHRDQVLGPVIEGSLEKTEEGANSQ